jgi:S-adenosylmethionine uptake transporter
MLAFPTSRIGLGILLILLGSMASNMLDITIRVMQQIELSNGTKAFSSFEIMTARTFWGIPLVIVFALIDASLSHRAGGIGWRWRFPGYKIAVGRSILYLQVATGFFVSLEYLSVGNVTLLFFVYPLFITLLSAPILGDKVGPWRGGASLVGFAGIGLVALAIGVDPKTDSQSVQGYVPWWAIALPLWSGLMYAAAQMLMRFVPKEVPGMMISLYTQVLAGIWCVLIMTAAAFFWPQGGSIGHLSAVKEALDYPNIVFGFLIFGAFSMAFLSQAFRFAPAVILGSLDYVAVLGAYVFGYLVLGDLPPTNSSTSYCLFAAGTALILISAATLVYREVFLQRSLASASAAK